MKKFQYTLVALLFLSTAAVTGQNLVDALRYSDYRIQGTARSSAMGNAFGALGGDFSSLSINPAGLGVYRSSEYVFTPTLGKTNVDATYLGYITNESKYTIGLSNVGYVANLGNGNNHGGSMVNINLGFGYNRLNNFNVKKMVEASNANSTLLDEFTANANADIWSDYYEELAWDTDLLIQDEETGEYFNDIADAGYGQGQRKSFSQKGNIDEYLISMAANFNHKFYLGVLVGIHSVNFKETTNLFEYDTDDNIIPYFNNYNFNTYLNTTGTGVNVKVGAIFKPIDALRIGAAVHSPTFYRMNERFDNTMTSYITFEDGSEEFKAYSPLGDYDYNLETPMKAVLSAALVLGKSAILSADYEYVDYSTIKFGDGGDGYDYYDENQDIKAAYKAVGNIRAGAELRLSPEFSIRGGYEYFPSPYNSRAFNADHNSRISNSAISGGLGFRQGGFFFDLAYKHFMDENYTELYSGSNLANYDISKDHLIMTLGFRF